MRKIGIVAQKGGQGKTTSVLSLAAALAGQGRGVLTIDTDTQANATHVLLGGEPPRRPTLADVLLGECAAAEAIVPTTFSGVSLIPAEPNLADVNVQLASEVGRERRLRAALAEPPSGFEVCLVDTGPTRSLLTTNVLNYVTEVIVPISPGLFGFLGLGQLQTDMGQVRRFLENKSLRLAGIYLAAVERNNLCRDFEREVREMFGELVFRTTVPRSVKFEEANARRVSIFEHAPRSAGAAAYQALALEVWNRGRTDQANRDEPADGDLSTDNAA